METTESIDGNYRIAYCRKLKKKMFLKNEKWQIENSETSDISEILFRVFLCPSFRFYPIAKIENWDLKISEKNFRVFRVFDLGLVAALFFLFLFPFVC